MIMKELWAIVSVGEVLKNTEIDKVLNCYDFEKWEVEELMNLENNTDLSLNEFRWEYLRETLYITDNSLTEKGLMVRDLIEDIKMGYYKMENLDKDSFKLETMNFNYELYRDFETFKISNIHIYYDDANIDNSIKEKEIKELMNYLNLSNGQAYSFINLK